jgi:hypothetical protein
MSDDIQAVPDYPENQQISSTSTSNAIKIATPDLILLDGATLPVDLMTDLLFENIGGQEIISISRNDIVNGQEVSYNLIGNTGLLNRQYNTKNIFSVSGTLDTYFANFSIRLDTHIPEEGTGPATIFGDKRKAYVEESSGDIIIDITNMEVNERLDVEVLKEGFRDHGTIYVGES